MEKARGRIFLAARARVWVLGVLGLLAGILFSAQALAQQLYERSWAVVIGIDRYQHWPHLQAAVADAKAMAQRLQEMGFETITFMADQEATRDRILTEIGTRLSSQTGPNDRVLIYFAGHGYTEELPNGDQVGYLIPVDCPQSNFFTHAISMQQIRETFSRMRAKHIYYMIDSCFSGYGFTRGAGMAPGARGYLQVVTEKRAVQMITAGRKGDLAHEEKGHGIFTLYLLRGLRGEADLNSDGLVTASELGSYVQPNVYQASGQKQLPQYGRLEGEGEVVFLVGEAPQKKQARERIQALEKELSRLEEQRRSLEGKKELLLTDIMKLDVEIRQNREKAQLLQKELEEVKISLEPPRAQGQMQTRPSPLGSLQTGQSPSAPQLAPAGSRFRDLGNGTVLDSRTGLLWEKAGSERPVRFAEAQAHVERLNREKFAGYSDWRVPRLEELQGLLIEAGVEGLRLDPLFDRRVPACWSSTQYAVGAQKHHAGLDFRDGTVLTRSELTEGYYVKAVRGKTP